VTLYKPLHGVVPEKKDGFVSTINLTLEQRLFPFAYWFRLRRAMYLPVSRWRP
jgi:hypothetical protein